VNMGARVRLRAASLKSLAQVSGMLSTSAGAKHHNRVAASH
jgi:hypothetical protein